MRGLQGFSGLGFSLSQALSIPACAQMGQNVNPEQRTLHFQFMIYKYLHTQKRLKDESIIGR
jgi:hypothetical protein